MALILREMTSTYGRSPGGYIWAILEPLGMIALLSVAFSLLLRSPSLGSNFILFYATGYLPFMLYQQLSVTVMRSIKFSKPLLLYPSVTWLDAVIARFALNTLTQIMAGFILLAAILLIADTHTVLDITPILIAICLAALLGLGIGLMNCLLNGLFPVWGTIWAIATRPLFLASAILYIYEEMPDMLQNMLWYNPLVHITGMFRSGVFSLYDPVYLSPLYVLGVAMVTIVLGLILMRRYHKDILGKL